MFFFFVLFFCFVFVLFNVIYSENNLIRKSMNPLFPRYQRKYIRPLASYGLRQRGYFVDHFFLNPFILQVLCSMLAIW